MAAFAGRVVSEALALAAAIACTLTAGLLAFAPSLVAAVAMLPPETAATAAAYVRWRALGLPAAMCFSVAQAFFLACRAPRTPMLATALTALVNLGGDLVLCCGFGMGAAGAAAATAGVHMSFGCSCRPRP